MAADLPAFSRGPNGTMVELRGYVPRHIADLLDAESLGKRMHDRWSLVAKILAEHCTEYEHEHTVAANVLGLNPQARSDGEQAR